MSDWWSSNPGHGGWFKQWQEPRQHPHRRRWAEPPVGWFGTFRPRWQCRQVIRRRPAVCSRGQALMPSPVTVRLVLLPLLALLFLWVLLPHWLKLLAL